MRLTSSNRHGGILRWLTVLVLISGSLSWMPALAGETDVPVATTIASVEITCPSASATVPGTLIVVTPSEGVVVNVELLAGDTSVDSETVTLAAASTSYSLEFSLEAGDIALGSTIKAVATFAGGGTSTESTPRAIGSYQGTTVCVPDGGLPVAPSPTPSPVPSPTPSPSPVPSPTPVPGQSPTPTSPTTGTGTVVNTGGANLNCRTAPVDGAVIVKLAPGVTVPVTGAAQSGWVPVTCGGQAGWISAQYLSIATGGGGTQPTPTETGSGYVTVTGTNGDNLRCRTAPVSGATIVLMPPGTRLAMRGEVQNGWIPVTCSGQAGWAASAYLTSDPGSSSTPTPTPGGGGTGNYVTVDGTGGAGLRCRTAPSTGAVITILADGTRVQTRGANSGGWLPVICAGQNGYISASYVMVEVPAGSGELWFDVNLSSQYMWVYRGSTVIMQTYVSTGRPGFDTPTGTFYINRKLVTRTMTGVLGGEYYNVPNVPWVMYFTNVGHAIHGAYWHNAFGTRRSHGCINLPVPFSEQLYHITPIGTRVRIHY